MIGRPVSFHAMRGVSAHSNGFQTCRAIHLLQLLLGAIDWLKRTAEVVAEVERVGPYRSAEVARRWLEGP